MYVYKFNHWCQYQGVGQITEYSFFKKFLSAKTPVPLIFDFLISTNFIIIPLNLDLTYLNLFYLKLYLNKYVYYFHKPENS